VSAPDAAAVAAMARMDADVEALCRRSRAGLLGRRPWVALDFDGTCIRGDVGAQLHFWLCARAAYRLDGPFWTVLEPEDGAARLQASWQGRAGWPDPAAGAEDPALTDLIAVWARRFARVGPARTFGWAAAMHVGMWPDQVAEEASAMLAWEKAQPLWRGCRSAPDGTPTWVLHGIRSRPAVQGWVRTLADAGIEARVVSATNRWAVARAASEELGVPPDRVLGNVCAIDVDGRIGDQVLAPVVWHGGKVQAIRAAGWDPPVMAMGDTVSDEPMLAMATHLAVLLDHGGDAALASRARAAGWVVLPRGVPSDGGSSQA
jgi:phosphoserine phosphatase